ncbi:hypothetical protein [Candidatus Amarobacter glycogenicus]|nr:hypothetical protein [Dehalococcoidia bacterium]
MGETAKKPGITTLDQRFDPTFRYHPTSVTYGARSRRAGRTSAAIGTWR